MSRNWTGDFTYENQKCFIFIVKSYANIAMFIADSQDVHDVPIGSALRKDRKRIEKS